jgi:photosystem II stability/assembly factor-like uncharacterized protein
MRTVKHIGKIIIVSILFLLKVEISNAQNLQKPSVFEISTLPDWAKEMYSANPNLFTVDKLYARYLKENEFIKSYHTQYYKRWRRSVLNFITADGTVQYPSKEEIKSITSDYKEKQKNKPDGIEKSNSNWSLVGPVQVFSNDGIPGNEQANIYSIDQSISSPNVMYCGTEPGEVYKSTDTANTWFNISMGENFGSGVTAIEVDPTNSEIVFAGGNDGVFRSIDGGLNWINVLPENNFGVNEILVNPENTQIISVASDEGFYRSVDGGTEWTEWFNQKSYDVKCNTADASIMYLVKNNSGLDICEFYSSTDFGYSWNLQSTGWYSSTDAARFDGGARIGVTPADANRVYAYLIGEAKENDYGFIGVYKSEDGGNSWTLPNGPAGGPYTATHQNLAYGYPDWTYHQGFYNCGFMVSETNADQILIGGLNMWKSNNGGATFTSVAGYVGGPLEMHVDMQDFRAINGNYWASCDGGIYKSNDFYNSQPDFKMKGVHASDYWGFGSGWNEDVLVGGLYHNGNLAYHENYGAGQFLALGGGEAPTGYVNPGDNRRTYFSDIGGKYLPLAITDPITNTGFGIAPNETYFAAESSEMEFHPNCYGIAYVGKENKLWKTTDAGSSFTSIHIFGTNVENKINSIEISSNNAEVIYLNQQPASGSTGTLWKTTDAGENWNSLPIPSGNSRRMLLNIDPTNDQIIWIAYPDGSNGNKIFKSINGGLNWENITTTTLNNESVQSIAAVAGTDGGIYYFTDKAVYYRNNTAEDWEIDNTGLPLYFSSNISHPFYRDGKIRVASYGKGIWESGLSEEPNFPIARASVDKLLQTVVCQSDSFYFEDHSFLNHTNASWQWSFPNGSPSNSSIRNPAVLFAEQGEHLAVLTITDGNGIQDIDSITVNLIYFNTPAIVEEDFQEAFVPEGWENTGSWSLSPTYGGFGLSTQSTIYDNYNLDLDGASEELRFTLNTVNANTDLKITFDVAYAPWGTLNSDTLEVLVSTDCGENFTSVYFKGGTELSTAPTTQSAFYPTNNQWRKDSISFSQFIGYEKIMIAFKNIGNYGNSLYIDNINISDLSVGLSETKNANIGLSIYPNPINAGEILNLNLPVGNATIKIISLEGKKIIEKKLSNISKVEIPANISKGNYILNIETENNIWNKVLTVK